MLKRVSDPPIGKSTNFIKLVTVERAIARAQNARLLAEKFLFLPPILAAIKRSIIIAAIKMMLPAGVRR